MNADDSYDPAHEPLAGSPVAPEADLHSAAPRPEDVTESREEEESETPAITVSDNEIGGDANVAGRDLYVTKYMQALAYLQPRPISRTGLLLAELFEAPGGYADTVLQLKADVASGERVRSVLALVTEPGVGARTTAMRLLDDCLPQQARLFELFADWEKPDAALIPRERHTGYLLNLAGESELLSDQFREQLAEYARQAFRAGTVLVVLVSRQAWGPVAEGDDRGPVLVREAKRPSAAGVVERRLSADPETAERAKWLHLEESVFHNLLTPDTSPSEGERLAGIMARATGHDDANARGEYENWEEVIHQWFGGEQEEAPRPRALRIAASFLDECPARVILDASDSLLGQPEIGWPAPLGGPLAGPGAERRCKAADIAFREDGTASISQDRPGIDRALLRHVWYTRPQLVPVLTKWLEQISAAGAVAEPYRERLAASLTALAESEGPKTILELLDKWIAQDGRKSLALDVLDDLAVHPLVGAAVRQRLRGWAEGKRRVDRQLAVVGICSRRLGREFPHIALTRLRYVLDKPGDESATQAALDALVDLLHDTGLAAQVLKSLVDWISFPGHDAAPGVGSASAFIDVLAVGQPGAGHAPGAVGAGAPLVLSLLQLDGPEGGAVRVLLKDGVRAAWRHPDIRAKAAVAVDSWCRAAEAEELPTSAVRDLISVVFEEEVGCLGSDLNRILGGNSELRNELRFEYAQAILSAKSTQASTAGIET
ncbi:hypothetical protein [Kitasatospora purpeofusca]|uniref:hypothetical protein n=1 Tax=Kitasatospora purpeofusca TaxID=67352 RepID=UPI00364739D2